jgi:hypothetical protein
MTPMISLKLVRVERQSHLILHLDSQTIMHLRIPGKYLIARGSISYSEGI